MSGRGLFGLRGLVSDYLAFRQNYGDSRRAALAAAIDYWHWDRANWMGWHGLPRNAEIRKLFR